MAINHSHTEETHISIDKFSNICLGEKYLHIADGSDKIQINFEDPIMFHAYLVKLVVEYARKKARVWDSLDKYDRDVYLYTSDLRKENILTMTDAYAPLLTQESTE